MEMGESAAPCLMRSVSQPFFASCEYKEGDPLRALTTSISFGRFMTEPLDWERWSSFSHNRTLEDVQKYSRPGVVAEKKAFFEAHYKKIAAKKAAKSPKKENKAPNYSPENNATSPNTLSRNLDPKRSNSHSAVDDTGGNKSSTLANNIVLSHANEYMPSGSQVEQEKASIENVPSPSTNQILPQYGDVVDDAPSGSQVEWEKASVENVSLPSTNQVFSQFDDDYDNVPSGSQVEQEKVSIKNVSSPSTNLVSPQFGNDDDNVPSGSQVEQEKASIKNVSSPSINQVFPQFGNVVDNLPSGSQMEQEKASIENVPSPSTNQVFPQFGNVVKNVLTGSCQVVTIENVENSSQSSDDDKNKDAANGRDKVSTKPEISSSKSLSKNGAYKLQSPRKAPTPPTFPRKAAANVTEKKISAPQSIHMSMNFPPARKNIGLYSSPFAPKNGTSKTIGKAKDRQTEQALTRVSVNGVNKGSQVFPRQENRRSKPVPDSSISGRRTVDTKSLSTNHSEASSLCTKKPRSSYTVPTSFSFRSEERAAKRKEFFQKLEEKSNTKEIGTIQLQQKLKEKARNDNKKLRSEIKAPSNSMQKEKARNDNKKLRCAAALEAKPSTSETTAPSNSMEKVTPKLGRKPTPRLVQDTCYQSPWRSSFKPKNFIEINKKILSSSMASLPTKKMYDSTLMSKK